MAIKFLPLHGVEYKYDYVGVFDAVHAGKIPRLETYRQLCKDDLFFLLCFGLGRFDANHPFVVQAVREVEEDHSDTLDLWAREHYKSTILTYALVIQELIRNPEERIAIFSHTRPIAKGFLRQIKQTLEGDVPVKRWFKDVFWTNPKREAPKWSEDDGLIVKRRATSKEASIEAWGLVDGQPTSKHFTIRVYDDCVTRESVTSPDQIKKVRDAYELSQSLGTDGGTKRLVGTHYHFSDLYAHLKKVGGYKVRTKPATTDGTMLGEPVLLSPARLDELRREQGPYVFSCQQLLNPLADANQELKLEWLRHYDKVPEVLNRYIVCDPANEKKKSSDYTVMAVIGLDANGNRFLLDLVRDRLNLTERWEALKGLYLKHRPILRVGYEKYGMQADISYFDEKQREEGLYFKIHHLGGSTSKLDRIRRLVPLFEEGRFLLPHRLVDPVNNVDLVKVFVDDEYATFPFCPHDDMLDCLARIEDEDMGASGPMFQTAADIRVETHYDVLRGAYA